MFAPSPAVEQGAFSRWQSPALALTYSTSVRHSGDHRADHMAMYELFLYEPTRPVAIGFSFHSLRLASSSNWWMPHLNLTITSVALSLDRAKASPLLRSAA